MKKAFTLIEILIASTIFVIVMIMSTSIFSMASSFIVKLHEMRNTTMIGHSAMESVTSDVRAANGPIKLKVRVNDGASTSLKDNFQIGELAFVNCPNRIASNCVLIGNSMKRPSALNKTKDYNTPSTNNHYGHYQFPLEAPTADPSPTNALLIVRKDKNKFVLYWNDKVDNPDGGPDNFKLYRYEGTLPADGKIDFTSNSLDIALSWYSFNIEGNDGADLQAVFAGYGPDKATRKFQPYVEFMVKAESWDYDATLEQFRAKIYLKTLVEARDYNPV